MKGLKNPPSLLRFLTKVEVRDLERDLNKRTLVIHTPTRNKWVGPRDREGEGGRERRDGRDRTRKHKRRVVEEEKHRNSGPPSNRTTKLSPRDRE